MGTILKDWQLVSILDDDRELAVVLFGIVVSDSTCRFVENDYVCSSVIVKINSDARIVETKSGSIYHLEGVGIKAGVQYQDFEMLRNGYSPQEISLISSRNYFQ
ncbi:hypothetical protein [Pseudoalteromonas sp. T1lg122]|uniref:hypothetical protein n=1 Tax=Pseudoalteromonas sp. T1lg122 TaxID=2077094 RepID=UPI000CF64FAC|nr:hypothetical protein [Pseudoalteromonas sp. T1lg122]